VGVFNKFNDSSLSLEASGMIISRPIESPSSCERWLGVMTLLFCIVKSKGTVVVMIGGRHTPLRLQISDRCCNLVSFFCLESSSCGG
jgi:hypothetical protein